MGAAGVSAPVCGFHCLRIRSLIIVELMPCRLSATSYIPVVTCGSFILPTWEWVETPLRDTRSAFPLSARGLGSG